VDLSNNLGEGVNYPRELAAIRKDAITVANQCSHTPCGNSVASVGSSSSSTQGKSLYKPTILKKKTPHPLLVWHQILGDKYLVLVWGRLYFQRSLVIIASLLACSCSRTPAGYHLPIEMYPQLSNHQTWLNPFSLCQTGIFSLILINSEPFCPSWLCSQGTQIHSSFFHAHKASRCVTFLSDSLLQYTLLIHPAVEVLFVQPSRFCCNSSNRRPWETQ
jgi:hypothetical protein